MPALGSSWGLGFWIWGCWFRELLIFKSSAGVLDLGLLVSGAVDIQVFGLLGLEPKASVGGIYTDEKSALDFSVRTPRSGCEDLIP